MLVLSSKLHAAGNFGKNISYNIVPRTVAGIGVVADYGVADVHQLYTSILDPLQCSSPACGVNGMV